MKGQAWKFGNNIDTDLIIPARYLNTSDPAELAQYAMMDADSEWVDKMSKGDFIVAGDNFGCGSSREHAPIALKAVGVSAIIAKSFARIFYRNSINIGLPILEAPQAAEEIKEGDEIEVDLNNGVIRDLTSGKSYKAQPFPEFMQKIITAGGLINYIINKIKTLKLRS
ncbi:MAG: 3-isopropylmalate dehydratase small subunit [Candidatus Margulisiibacteriota bacterium]